DGVFLESLIGQLEALAVDGLDVDATEQALVREIPVVHQGSGVDMVHVLEDLRDRIELRLADLRNFIGEAGSDGAVVLRLSGRLMLISTIEEQVITPNRATERNAPALVGLNLGDGTAADGVAAKVAVGKFIERAAVEPVGTRLGHDVDRAAGELAIFDIERSELDLRLAHRVIGDRSRAAGRETRVVETVNVALRNAVDGEGVETAVAAEAGNAVGTGPAGRDVLAVEADAWVHLDHVADVAVERRRGLQHLLGERRARADLKRRSSTPCRGP